MQTTLYEITTKDGRIFRVFCANAIQSARMHIAIRTLVGCTYEAKEIACGIHTVKQFEDIIKSEQLFN